MSNVKAVYTQQGIILGQEVELLEGSITLKNPVMAIPQRDNMALIPFLALMEETEVTFKPSEIMYGQVFTPNIDLRNHYNKMFGTGIVEASPGAILSL